MCNLETNELFNQLHHDYYNTINKVTKLNARNAIQIALIPLMEQIANKYNGLSPENREDLFQFLLIEVLENFIPKWKPTGNSIVGYYKSCLYRAGLNWLRVYKAIKDKEIYIDEATGFWEFQGKEDKKVHIPRDTFKFQDSIKQKVYLLVLEQIERSDLPSKETYGRDLAELSGLSVRECRKIYEHALITCREYYNNVASDRKQIINKDTFFGRMANYLTTKQTQEVIKMFSGCEIRIPIWKD